MKQVRFEFEELPYETLSQFGLTREMIEDLPMHILEELSNGRHSPVLPIKVNDDNGNTVTDRSRFAFVRKENGEADVVFYPVLKKSTLEKYSEDQQKQLRSGKVILADTVTADGRKTKAFVQIDTETNQVMSVPTQVIARNLQVTAEELKLSIRFCQGDAKKWSEQTKREWDKYTFGCYGCWMMDDDGNLDYIPEEQYTEELWNEQKKSAQRNMGAGLHK